MTIADLKVGDEFPPDGVVYHVSELTGGYRHLVMEVPSGRTYTTYLHRDTPIDEAIGGGSYSGDSHVSWDERR